MSTTRWEIVMDTEDKQELKLLRSKVKYLEDRIEVMARSIGSINKILGRFQMTENNDSGFKDIDTRTHDHELI